MTDQPFPVETIESPLVPAGMAYLVPPGALTLTSMTPPEPDPWPEPSYDLEPAHLIERQRGLNFLASLLDDWCTESGWEVSVWRYPRLAQTRREEQERARRTGVWRWRMDERVALSVNRPPGAFVINVGP